MTRIVLVWAIAYVLALAAGIVVFTLPTTVFSGVPPLVALRDLGEVLWALLPRVGLVLLVPAVVLFWLGAKGRGPVAYAICGAALPAVFVVGSEIAYGAGDWGKTLTTLTLVLLPGAVAGLVFHQVWRAAA